MKLDWLTEEAEAALDKLESMPTDSLEAAQKRNDEFYALVNADFKAQYVAAAKRGGGTLNQALKAKGVQLVSKFTKPRRRSRGIANTVDLVRREHRLNGTEHLDVLAVVAMGVDTLPEPLPDTGAHLYTHEGTVLYLWDWMTAIMVTTDWAQSDHEMHVLVGID